MKPASTYSKMFRLKEALPAFRASLIFTAMLLIGCQSSLENNTAVPPAGTQKIFFVPFDVVWRAAQLSIRYPLQINNQETGVMETEWIREPEGFLIPGSDRKPSMGIRYKLRLLFVRGELDTKSSTRITVLKRAERTPDFFSDPQPIQLPNLEEQSLLYRIERELQIEEGIKKANRLAQEKSTATESEPGSEASHTPSGEKPVILKSPGKRRTPKITNSN